MSLTMNNNRILIIEDDPLVVLFLQDHLEFLGFSVIFERDGYDGLIRAQNEKPDLIVLDVMLPSMDGYEICRQLKEQSDTWVIPILMLTAKGQTQDVVKGFEIGADDYLTKPYDNAELEARIKALLRRFSRVETTKIRNILDLGELHKQIISCFSDEELHTLCVLDLNVDYDSLNGTAKATKARELIMYLNRRNQLPKLIETLKELRPHADWNI